MKLQLLINGEPAGVELDATLPDCRYRLDGGRERTAQVERPSAGVYSVLLDGASYEVYLEEEPRGLIVTINGHRYDVEVSDPRSWEGPGARAGAHGAASIVAPMPGKVVRLLVAPGDTVAAGQGLVVVEAMKMQNEIKSPREARVSSIAVAEGATVSAGQVLVTIE